jgi:hypothetical protein
MSTEKSASAKKSAKGKGIIPPLEPLNKGTVPPIEPPKEPDATGAIPVPNLNVPPIIEPPIIPDVNPLAELSNAPAPQHQKSEVIDTKGKAMDSVIESIEHQLSNGVMKGTLQENLNTLKDIRKVM